jgi:outer membrane receptor protein involved in Fe transport
MALIVKNPSRQPVGAKSLGGKKFARTLLSGVALCAISLPAVAADSDSSGIAEIVVTAQKRSEKLQDVPIAIEAMTGDTLKELNVENFDDVAKYLPNVTMGGSGPGQSEIYMRGLSIGGEGGGQSVGATGSFPNVAIYLDDQSAQVPGRNLDIYSVDLQRIEVLEGPQGTLFGSGAQAGVVRYITNKPNLENYEAIVNAGTAGTVHGAMSANADATVNIPVIKDVLGLRVVAYDDRRGGYINNVPGTFVRQSTDLGIHYAGYTNNVPGPANAQNSANNKALVANNINPVTYEGVRAEILYKFDDDWNALLTQSFQSMDAEGVFYETPFSSGTGSQRVALPDLSVQLFNPSFDKDKFENTALTINGRIGDLNVVYNGAYLVRDVKQQQDYTNYARGVYADYYQCIAPSSGTAAHPAGCYSPSTTWRVHEKDTHLSQEGRVSTPDDWRLRAIGGIFWERFEIDENDDWEYKTAPGFTDVGTIAGTKVNNPGIRDNNDGFFNDVTRSYTQKAAFASVDYDIIPKVLTATFGGRYYRFDNTEDGNVGGSFGCFYTGAAPCLASIANIDGLKSHYSGFKKRGNLTWKITPDAMVYFTYSEGFRPGGFNRKSSGTQFPGFKTPVDYAPDNLTNYEVGYKTQWFNRHLEVNGSLYQEDWNNVQIAIFNPTELGLLTFTENGPNYRVRGAESEIVARPISGLSITGGGAVNNTNQLTSPNLIGLNGVVLTQIANPFGTINSSLAQSPLLRGNLRVRYDFEAGDYLPFAQIGAVYSGHTHSGIGTVSSGTSAVYASNYEETSYTTIDASIGISRDNWSITAYVDNLTNTRADLFNSDPQFVKETFVNRPLTAGLKVSYALGK